VGTKKIFSKYNYNGITIAFAKILVMPVVSMALSFDFCCNNCHAGYAAQMKTAELRALLNWFGFYPRACHPERSEGVHNPSPKTEKF